MEGIITRSSGLRMPEILEQYAQILDKRAQDLQP